MTALVDYVQGELDRIDRTANPIPAALPRAALNRSEYANTVRDLLGVDSRGGQLPADDTGYGFDNNGDVLTVSPALMDRYLALAEKIAKRAVGGDPFPVPAYFTRHDRVTKTGDGAIELRESLEYDADYNIKISITGNRGDKDQPVTLVPSPWMESLSRR